MRSHIRIFLLCFLVVGFLPAAPLIASDSADFDLWLAGLRREAFADGISVKTLDTTLAGLEPIPEILEKDRNQPEFKFTLEEYLARLVSDDKIKKGRIKLQEKKELLRVIEKRYGVPPHVLVAFWGLESDYGRLTGKQSVIASLATLAYDPRRSKFFRRELLHALHIVDEGHVAAEDLLGSWAGAMGQLQFIPSTFRNNAVDFDGDGKIEIWKDGGDLFASAANYLARCNWKKGWLWGREVSLPEGFDRSLIGPGILRSVPYWKSQGVTKVYGVELPYSRINATLLQPDGPGTRAFLVYDNFESILKWNRSVSYAIAVGLLSDRIRQ